MLDVMRRLLAMAAVASCLATAIAPPSPAEAAPLVVATKASPPFSLKGPDGRWRGISIELWRKVADRLGLEYRFAEVPLSDMVPGLAAGKYDAAVAALTVTADREQKIDFTHPFYISGLGIAVSARKKSKWVTVLERIFSWDFLQVIVALAVVLLLAGFLVWLFERRHNDEFADPAHRGLAAGFWWSAVTMTTVGYGDKSPRTLGGRLVALVWMFTSIVIIASFTGAIASALTVPELQASVQGPGDLPDVEVATVGGSTSASTLDALGARHRDLKTVKDAMDQLAAGRVDAVVYDAPILRYLIKTGDYAGIRVLPRTFERQDYGIGLPAGSPLRERINEALLTLISSPDYQTTLHRYLGQD